MSLQNLLFSTDLISPDVQAALPKNYTLRPLSVGDYIHVFLHFFLFEQSIFQVGHIEDIAVDKNQQGKKLGLRFVLIHVIAFWLKIKVVNLSMMFDGEWHYRIIQALKYIGAKTGCYKGNKLSC